MTPPTQDTEFARKLVLGLISTLQHKGLISDTEVDAILRAAMPKPAPPSPPLDVTPSAPMPKPDASRVRHEALPPPMFDIEL